MTDKSGKLSLVPTPIGNLEDITLRALRVVKACDTLLAEDTRKAGILLKHFEISKKIFAHHQHNEHAAISEIVKWLQAGQQICLISDAGTPSISDPGFLLVRACIQENIAIEVLPGPTAFVPALVASGLPSERFCFEGFLPVKKGRATRLKHLQDEERTMIFYESPHRILRTLTDFITYFGPDREAAISRELTKIYEETIRGTLRELNEIFMAKAPLGEFVVCVKGRSD